MQKTQLTTDVTIGFVGLGSMRAPLAGRLLQGNPVYGTNRTRARASALIRQGLIWRDTPREVAASAQVVFSMVTDDAALAAVTSGPDGILAGLRPGTVYVDMSTVSPQASRGLAARAMTGSAIGSPMLQARAPLVLDLPEQAWFDVQLMHKDIRLALEAGRLSGVTLPAASVAGHVLSQAEERGFGHRDIAGLY